MTRTLGLQASLFLCAASLLGACSSARAPQTTTPAASADATDCGGACGAEALPLRQPVLRLTESGDWGSPVQESGVPTFTLYEDGLVIFADGMGADAKPMQARLSADEVDAMVELANESLGALPKRIRAAHGTDQAEAGIGVVYGGRIYSVSVYGFTADGSAEPDADPIPPAFVELHRRLQTFTADNAEPWTPDELVVSLFRRDDLGDEAKPWPQALPQPPADAREPNPRVIGRSGKTVQQAIRYRVSGKLEAKLAKQLPNATSLETVKWRGTAWLVRTERVVPQLTYFW